MNNKLVFILLIVLTASFFFTQCASRNVLSQLNFGVKAAENQLWDEAVFRWKKVVEASPRSAAAHNNLAVAYEKKGLWEEARREYQLALKLDPDNEYIQSNFKNFQSNHSMMNDEKKGKNENRTNKK
jgi:Flp pilus assembly protein TadD